jgi:hypothetical protein
MASQVKKTIVDSVEMEKIYFVLILDIILELSYKEQMCHVLHYVDPNADKMKVMESWTDKLHFKTKLEKRCQIIS